MTPEQVLAKHQPNPNTGWCSWCGCNWHEDGCDAAVMAREVLRLRGWLQELVNGACSDPAFEPLAKWAEQALAATPKEGTP